MSDFVWPSTPASGDQTTGPYGEVYEFDGVKWSLVPGGTGGGVDPADFISTDAGNTLELGSDNLLYVPSALAGSSVGIAFNFGDQPEASAIITVPMPFPIVIPANLAGSVGFVSGALPTANATFLLRSASSSGSQGLGSITIAPNDVFTFTGAGGSVPAGTALQLIAPSTQDATLGSIGITIAATRA